MRIRLVVAYDSHLHWLIYFWAGCWVWLVRSRVSRVKVKANKWLIVNSDGEALEYVDEFDGHSDTLLFL
jgi:hypothetical protein